MDKAIKNPIINVKVSVEEDIRPANQPPMNESKLLPILERLEDRIDLLLQYLDESN